MQYIGYSKKNKSVRRTFWLPGSPSTSSVFPSPRRKPGLEKQSQCPPFGFWLAPEGHHLCKRNCLFFHAFIFWFFGVTMLKSEIFSAYASKTSFKSFSSEKLSIRRFNVAKTDTITPRRLAPFAVLLVRPDLRVCASSRRSRSL